VTTYAALQTATTADAYLTQILATLAANGFPATAWQSGNAGRTLARADAEALADLRAVIADVVNGGFLDTATGDWLTLLAAGLFDLDRIAATYAIGEVTLTCSASAGPYNITAGSLVVSDGTRRWRSTNTSTLTLASGGTLTVEAKAESPGTAYNVSGAQVTVIVSPALAGVTVAAVSSWLTTTAVGDETDAALRARCRLRWSTLGRGANLDAYKYNALNAGQSSITRAQAVPGGGDGTLAVYVAQSAATATGPQVAAVQAYIDTVRPVTDSPTVTAATAVTVNVTATIYVLAASDSTANRALATDAMSAYINGLDLGDATVDVVKLGAAIYAAAGIRDVDVVIPAADVSISAGQVAVVGTYTLTWTPV
jgi:phage-related baseplate assembly protein